MRFYDRALSVYADLVKNTVSPILNLSLSIERVLPVVLICVEHKRVGNTGTRYTV